MAFNPPYSKQLGDALISQVIDRTIPRSQRVLVHREWDGETTQLNRQFIEMDANCRGTSSNRVSKADMTQPSLYGTSTSKHRTRYGRQVGKPYTRTKPDPVWTSEEEERVTQSEELKNSFAAVMAAKLAHQRVRGRMNQRRYRKKQEVKIGSLQKDIQSIQEEIHMYHMRKSNGLSTIAVKPTPWSVVVEYYRLFRRGVNPSVSTMPDTSTPSTLQTQYPVELVHQSSFLQTVMLSRVICGRKTGIEAHLEEWKTISRIYTDFDMKLVHLKEEPNGDIGVTSKATFTFTEDTLCNGFPHLVSNGNMNCLAAKLLGQKLEICSVARFVWDDTMARVSEVSFQTDLITPILNVLGSLDHVASVFSHALVTPEGHIIAQ